MSIFRKNIICLFFASLCIFLLNGVVQAQDVTPIVTDLDGAYGSDYVISRNQAFFVERYAGNIWSINMDDLTSSVIGTGYDEPMDIVVSSDDAHAYVVESGGGGTLLYVDLASANRASATVISTNIAGTSGHILGQLSLDEAHGHAYIVQNSGFGALWRINLATGTKTELLSAFETNPWGLILSSDLRYAYYSELGLDGKVKRLDLVTGSRETLVTGLTNPLYLAWVDPEENAIYVAESGAGRVSQLDLTETPVSVQQIITGLPNINTRSVTVISEGRLLISVHVSVLEVNLSPYSATGPIILGIGHVPFDRIINGYADTTGDPGYFFQVRDAAFGGTLSLMINHDGAYEAPMRARWYRVLVDGVEQQDSWNDYRWNTSLGRFVLETISPVVWIGHYYYPVRKPSDLWYNHWMGSRLNTRVLSNGSHTISVEMFGGIIIPMLQVGSDSLKVQIDNTPPTVLLEKIFHDGDEVDTCAIVDTCPSTFTFHITAYDPEGHLKSWRLNTLWGDNCYDSIDSDVYTNYLPGPLWEGTHPDGTIVPTSPWDAYQPSHPNPDCEETSCNCAHTFELWVWGRVINGYNYIHRTRYHKSITIMMNCPCLQFQ